MTWIDFSGINIYAYEYAPHMRVDYTKLSGTVSISSGSKTLNGTGTLFTSEVQVGDYIIVNNSIRKIVQILNDTQANVDVIFADTLTLLDMYRLNDVMQASDILYLLKKSYDIILANFLIPDSVPDTTKLKLAQFKMMVFLQNFINEYDNSILYDSLSIGNFSAKYKNFKIPDEIRNILSEYDYKNINNYTGEIKREE